ncbi:MAG: helix-turn-helix domain-containing protein, partial [bacterium]
EEFNLPRVINYMHYNPVDAGIVSKEGDYPFSSAGFYEGKKSYIEQLKKIDYDRSITDREFETYKGVIGTKKEYKKLLKRKPGREKSRYKERRKKSLTESMKILLDEQGLTRMIFFRRRSPQEKKKVQKIIRALLLEGYKQSDIARELKLGKSTIYKMLNIEKFS